MDGELNIEQIAEDFDAIEARVEKIEQAVTAGFEDLPDKIAKAVAEAQAKPSGEDEDKPTVADLSKKLDEFATDTAEKISKLGDDIEKLGDGTTSQGGDNGNGGGDDPERRDRVAKAFKDQGLDPDLAGVLS